MKKIKKIVNFLVCVAPLLLSIFMVLVSAIQHVYGNDPWANLKVNVYQDGKTSLGCVQVSRDYRDAPETNISKANDRTQFLLEGRYGAEVVSVQYSINIHSLEPVWIEAPLTLTHLGNSQYLVDYVEKKQGWIYYRITVKIDGEFIDYYFLYN